MKVVLPGWGFHVAANIAYSMGAKLEFRDVGIKSWCMDPDDNQDLMSTDEESILVLIHTLGNFGRMGSFKDFKSARNLFIVEDSAEALFSESYGKPLGTIFDVGTYSFHAAKTITSGEGGLFVASEAEDYERALLIRSHGMTPDRPYFHQIAGDNYRLSNLLAALLVGQIKKIDEIIFERNRVYKSYLRELNDFPPESFIQPTDLKGFFPWGFGFRIPSESIIPTAQIREKMKLRGIDTRPGFTSAAELPYFDKNMLAKGMELDNSESLAKQVILLPHYPNMTDEDVFKVCDSLIEILS
jgi:perosamine synthetase